MIPSTTLMEQAFPGYNHFVPMGEKTFSQGFNAVEKKTESQVRFTLIPMADLSHGESQAIRHELDRLQELRSPFVLSLLEHTVTHIGQDVYVVAICELFSGIPLNFFDLPLSSFKSDPVREKNLLFCSYATDMASAVRDFHAKGLQHRGINPHEYLINTNTGKVKLNGFPWNHSWRPECRNLAGMASEPDIFPYIAPEQTGRMNLAVDHRSNLYSLGVVFYEMLTGHCPFSKRNSVETIYSHMAREVTSPLLMDKGIHPLLSELVLKLLAKSPEDRYQSISGVIHDLERIESVLQGKTPFASFGLGCHDVSPVFSMPKGLYGRDKALDTLIQSYNRVRQGNSCVVFVSGGSGVGKTDLLRRFSQHVRASGGIFLPGKFDKNQEDVPLKGPKAALDSMIRWILTQPPESIALWRKKILDAVAPYGRILTDLAPEMEHILGKQPRLNALSPMESNIRFTQVLDKFISLFLDRDHPLVLFMDDLQWSDRESLEYGMSFLMSRKRSYCMGVGTYRDNEVDEFHPITPYLKKFKRISTPCETITLSNFEEDDTNSMVADILGRKHSEAWPLSRVVHEKTGGNPFFITQFMTSIHSAGMIHYDFDKGCWAYDMGRISAANITDNVATLLSEKIEQLPKDTLDVLRAASCVGNRLDTDLLSDILHLPPRHIESLVKAAVDEGILRMDSDPDNPDSERNIEFSHDHILQAVNLTLSDREARQIHLSIGRAMVRRCGQRMSMEEVFDIVHQFRLGLPLITSVKEKTSLARLNLTAGQRAIESVSFETALVYFRQAADLLPENGWADEYDLMDAVYNWLAKCEFILGDFNSAEDHYALLLSKAGHVRNKLRIYSAMVELYASSGQIDKAMGLGRTGLGLMGITLPEKLTLWSFIRLLIPIKLKWNLNDIKKLINSPEIRDHEHSMVLGLIAILGQSTFYADPKMALWLALKGGLLAVSHKKRYFQDEHVTIEFNVLAAFLSQLPGFRTMGRDLARLGMEMLEKTTYDSSQSVGNYLSAVFIRHWYAPVRQSILYLKRTYHHAYNARDIGNSKHGINTMFLSRMFAVHSIDSVTLARFYLGDNLDEIAAFHRKQESFVIRTRASLVISYYFLIGQLIAAFRGKTKGLTSLDSHHFDTALEYKNAVAESDRMYLFFLLMFQMKLEVFDRRWDKALVCARRIKDESRVPPGTLLHVAYYFYSFMAAVGVCYEMPDAPEKAFSRRIMGVAMRKMTRWARLRPDNFGHLLSLMRAEAFKLKGKAHKALAEYRRAIELSNSGNVMHIAALACESAGNLLLDEKDSLSASIYLNEAKKYYHYWGAAAKVSSMNVRYGNLVSKRREKEVSSPLAYMDFASLVGGLQAISKEIEVKKLLSRLMRIIMESTSATRAVFVSNKEGVLCVEMECSGVEENVTMHTSQPLETRQGTLMASVVNYVKQIRSPVVMNDIHQDSDFLEQVLRDPASPKALACLPMICKDALVGILYLENALTSGVFPGGRIEILNVIATQAAISFENASLYEHVIEKEQNLTQISTKLRNLYSELMLTEERERSRIAIDLHDRIGHALALVKMSLSAMRGASGQDLSRLIESSMEVVEQSIDDTRSLSFEISPPILYHLGLGPALDWLCEETQKKHGLTVIFDDQTGFGDEDAHVDRETNILCFQVIRELMFNAVKHAQAQSIRVTFSIDTDHVYMAIKDDGIGFDLERQNRASGSVNKGFGLFSIKERFQLVNGWIDIQSASKQGTAITMKVPRKHPQALEQDRLN